jgi:HAD superfamily hydrolase (TIGR01484 family)
MVPQRVPSVLGAPAVSSRMEGTSRQTESSLSRPCNVSVATLAGVRYQALICDYDGTIAHDGRVGPSTIKALERLVESGRRLVLVTGRDLPLLQRDFDRLDLFERVVVENGALMYDPATRSERLLTESADERLVEALRARDVKPLGVGRAIIATWKPMETVVLEQIRELGLELEIIFNKGAVMILPAGITKASGLHAALLDLGLSAHNTVGVGDAENDHAFLSLCGISAAVANALPALKERADLVLEKPRGEGVAELIERILEDDLRSVEPIIGRHRIEIGKADGESVGISGRSRVLLVGPSGGGKSTLVLAFLEELDRQAYQFLLVDPEGDYEQLEGGVVLGRGDQLPVMDELEQILADPAKSLAVNLLAHRLEERPDIFNDIVVRIQTRRTKTGRPHWLIVDEAHHLLPAEWHPAPQTLPRELEGLLVVTVHPDRLSKTLLEAIDVVVTVGPEPLDALAEFAKLTGRKVPRAVPKAISTEEGVRWSVEDRHLEGGPAVTVFTLAVPAGERRRHKRKYAQGELPEDRSFWFRGPDGKLNLRAQNLQMFLQIADGVDDVTWQHHRKLGDYSSWIRTMIKDDDLAADVAAVEEDAAITPKEGRERIRKAIEERYAAPA